MRRVSIQALCLASVLVFLLTGCAIQSKQSVASDSSNTVLPQRVLFVGNSYLYYNDSLHNHVRQLVAKAHPDLKATLAFKSATISGAHLDEHNLAHLIRPGKIGVVEPFQWVVLQGFSAAALSDKGRSRFRNAVVEASTQISQQGGRVALYMTPAYVAPNRRADADGIRLIERLYISVAKDIGARVIPVGLAFEEAYRRRPEIQLHKGDGSHPSLAGTYLAACTVYAALYGESVVGNAYDYYGAVDKDTAKFLQQVAEDTVLAFERRE